MPSQNAQHLNGRLVILQGIAPLTEEKLAQELEDLQWLDAAIRIRAEDVKKQLAEKVKGK